MNRLIILLLSVITLVPAVRAQESEVPEGYEYVPFVVEGKTWWYETEHWSPEGLVEHWYGITLAGDTIVDDITWKKCLLIDESRKLHTRPMILVREEERRVYTCNIYYEEPFYEFPDYVSEALSRNYVHETNSFMIFDFNLEVGDGMDRWFPGEQVPIKTITYMEIYGKYFKVYDAEPLGPYSTGKYLGVYEGIGWFDFDALFLTPFMGRYECAFPKDYYLLWVTNPDGSILFEGRGGPKLWEQEGVTDAVDAPLQIVSSGRCVTVGGVAEAEVLATDMAGTTVLRDVIPAGKPLSLTHIAPGVYIIHATTPTGHTATKKVVL